MAELIRVSAQSRSTAVAGAIAGVMREQGYGEGYVYDHDTAEACSGQDFFPEEIGRQQFYAPPERGPCCAAGSFSRTKMCRPSRIRFWSTA